MSVSIAYRVKTTQNFTIIQNDLINSTLSLDAKALLIWALSKPEGWKVSHNLLASNHNISRAKVQRIVNELKASGHLKIKKHTQGATSWLWCEDAHANAHVENAKSTPKGRVVEPYPENQDVGYPQVNVNDPEYHDHEYHDHEKKDPLVSTDLKQEQKKLIRTERALSISDENDQAVKTATKNIFDFWKKCMGKTGTVKLTPKREKAIILRLKDGYTEQEIQTAIKNCASSAWHMGQNDRQQVYDDIELICRSGEKLESFRDKPQNDMPQLSEAGRQTYINGLQWLKDEGVL